MMTTERMVPPVEDRTEPTTFGSRFSDAAANLKEVQAYASHYLSAQLDRARLVVRNIVVLSILGLVAGIAGAAIVVTAAVMLCTGIAGGLGRLFGSPWLGDLVASLLIFAVIGIGTWWFVKRLTKSSRQQVIGAYEQRKSQQRSQFGADVHDRSEH